MTLHITLEPPEDGWIVAECPALPGCVSQGLSQREAITNICEAISAWIWAENKKALDQNTSPCKTVIVTV